jgi:hypothetical protein
MARFYLAIFLCPKGEYKFDCILHFKPGPSWSWSYGSWINPTTYAIRAYHYWYWDFESHSGDTTLCDKVCRWLMAGRWFSPSTLVSATNKTDCHDVPEILLKVALNTINLDHHFMHNWSAVICLVRLNFSYGNTKAVKGSSRRQKLFITNLKLFSCQEKETLEPLQLPW